MQKRTKKPTTFQTGFSRAHAAAKLSLGTSDLSGIKNNPAETAKETHGIHQFIIENLSRADITRKKPLFLHSKISPFPSPANFMGAHIRSRRVARWKEGIFDETPYKKACKAEKLKEPSVFIKNRFELRL
jgi:hypothetical protein